MFQACYLYQKVAQKQQYCQRPVSDPTAVGVGNLVVYPDDSDVPSEDSIDYYYDCLSEQGIDLAYAPQN